MDPTTQALLAALIGAIVAGGAVLAWHVSDRQQHRRPQVEEPLVPPGVAAVLSVLRSSAVVVDAERPRAQGLRAGVRLRAGARQRVLVDELRDLVRVRYAATGRSARPSMHSPATGCLAPRTVTARVAPLGSRLVLALVEDRTRERRVEAVRRDFVANVSHELKTPVGAIRLLAEAVHDAADDPEAVQRFAGRMLTESDRLSRLVQQIIELSRLQGDDPLETPVPVRLDEVVAAAVDTSAIDAAAKDITARDRRRPRPGGLRQPGADRRRGRNLVANAVAYSAGGSTVLVSTKADGDTVEISVVDQGIGIPAARDRPDLRAVLPRRPGPAPLHRRHRPRPLHRQARRGHPRRRRHASGRSRARARRSP